MSWGALPIGLWIKMRNYDMALMLCAFENEINAHEFREDYIY